MSQQLIPEAVKALENEFAEVSATCLVTVCGITILLSAEAVADINRQIEDDIHG